MKTDLKSIPRKFEAAGRTISDYGKIHLAKGEMVTIVTESGRECDVTASEWGLYLAPSLNSRLKAQGLKVALVRNEYGKYFLNAVEEDKIKEFELYLAADKSRIVAWLEEGIEKYNAPCGGKNE